jgi:guanine deaminase
MKPEDYMRMAIAKCREGVEKGQAPFAAAIVMDGKVVACEHNSVWRDHDPTAHGEVNALRAACRSLGTIDLPGADVYSVGEPCPMCFAACHWAKVARVYYGITIEDALGLGFHELTISNTQMKEKGGSPVEVIGPFLRDECLEVARLWKRLHGEKTY